MELIYSRNGIEQGILKRFTADFEESTDVKNNTFEIQIPLDQKSATIGDYIYEDGEEHGGIVDALKVDTSASVLTLSGRTWRGVLGSKVIEPPESEAYYTVFGDANRIIADIIDNVSLVEIFSVLPPMGQYITWKFDRYTDVYTGIIKMLSRNGLKLQITNQDGIVMLGAVPIVDYGNDADVTSYQFDFKLENRMPTANHMIGLGSGELTDRMVIHKYIQEDGSVGDTQFFFGVDEVVAKYDYPNCESIEELEKATAEELEKCAVDDALEISAYELNADIGDKFLAVDETTGLSATQYVIDKIITATDSTITKTQYKVGGKIL